MSAFEGTFLDVALRDLGVNSFAICGIATEIGIEPTVRHGADLGYIPVVVEVTSESGGVRLPIHPYSPLLHNNSGSDAG